MFMANYQRLTPSAVLLPSGYAIAGIVLGLLAFLAFSLIYAYGTENNLIGTGLQPYIIDPLTKLLAQYNLTDVANNITTFALFAVVGLLVYALGYVFINNIVLIRNETLLDSFHHPTTRFHHWGRFFSVETGKVIAWLLFVAGVVILVNPVLGGVYRQVVATYEARSLESITLLLLHVSVAFLLLVGMTIAAKLARSLHV